MNTLVKQLGKRLMDNGEFRWGAIARASEHLGVSRMTVTRWFTPNRYGERNSPRQVTLAKIETLLRDKSVQLTARKPGPKKGISLCR